MVSLGTWITPFPWKRQSSYLYIDSIARILIEVDDLGDSGSPVDNWHYKRRSLSWVWERDDSFLLMWTGTIFLTEVGNAKFIVPYKLDEHFASGLHDGGYLSRFHENGKFRRPSK